MPRAAIRRHAAVAFTTGIIEQLSSEELAGVAAHELAHIKHRDTLTMTITAVIAGAISMLANMAFFMGGDRRNQPGGMAIMLAVTLLAPVAAMLVQAAISRSARIRSRPRRRRDFRPSDVAGLRAGPDRAQCARRHTQPGSRRQSGYGASVHHQPAAWRPVGSVLDPPSTEERIARLTADGVARRPLHCAERREPGELSSLVRSSIPTANPLNTPQ